LPDGGTESDEPRWTRAGFAGILKTSEARLRLFLLLPLLGVLGCDGGQSGENYSSEQPCQGITYTEVAPDDDSLGFTAEELFERLPLPSGVRWTETPRGPATDPLSLTEVTLGGPVRIADLSATTSDCYHGGGPKLVVPISFDVEIGDGAVLGGGTIELWATGPEPADIHVGQLIPSPSNPAVPVALSGVFEDDFDRIWATYQADFPAFTDFVVEGLSFVPYGTWDDLGVAIELRSRHSGGSGIGVPWQGVAVFEESAP
jgi:hypothetical protein